MKNLMIFGMVILFALALLAGCGEKKAETADPAPAIEQPAETPEATTADTTAADTATAMEGEGWGQ